MKSDFNSYALEDKVHLISHRGRYLISTNFHGANVKLYELNSFFVEVYYHPVLKHVMRISVASEDDLRKHLGNITFTL
jgi:hypothetical protein